MAFARAMLSLMEHTRKRMIAAPGGPLHVGYLEPRESVMEGYRDIGGRETGKTQGGLVGVSLLDSDCPSKVDFAHLIESPCIMIHPILEIEMFFDWNHHHNSRHAITPKPQHATL